VLVTPAVVLLTAMAIGPILLSVWLSLHRRWPIFGIDEFVGAANYVALWHDSRFWNACAITVYFAAVSVLLEVILGFGMAWLLALRTVGSAGFAKALLILPWAIPTVVSARMWEWLYQTDYGLLNYLLSIAGWTGEPVAWLGTPTAALHAAIAMDVWKTTPFAALFFLAGLHGIPSDLYQAARVDGARPWTVFRRITLPLLVPVLVVVLMFRTMDALRVFDAMYVLTGGGPGNATETLSIYAYKTLFQSLQFGYGATLATAMLILTAGCATLYLIVGRTYGQEA
jgi:multiple sugar transport system permease protein